MDARFGRVSAEQAVTRPVRRPPLVRRPSFWLIVVLVIVIPTLAFFSTQWLLRVLRPPGHSSGSSLCRPDGQRARATQEARSGTSHSPGTGKRQAQPRSRVV